MPPHVAGSFDGCGVRDMKIWATLDDPWWQVLLSRLFVFAFAVLSAYFATRFYESAQDRARPHHSFGWLLLAYGSVIGGAYKSIADPIRAALRRRRPRGALNYGVVATHQDAPAGNPDPRRGEPHDD